MVVYKIEIQGKIYVGSSKNHLRRWKEHKRNLEGNKHHNLYLQRLYNKYGNPLFEVIEQLETVEQMENREEYWINEIGALNHVKTAVGGDRTSQLSGKKREEWKQKLSKRNTERYKKPGEREKCNVFKNLPQEEREERLKVWSDAKKGSKNSRYKYDRPVKQIDKITGDVIRTYKDLCEVVEVTGFERRNILNCLKNKPSFLSAKGFKWVWI